MVSLPAAHPAWDVPPPARRLLDALTEAPTAPTKIVLSGGFGTGKSTVLAAARDILRAQGVTVITKPPRPNDDCAGALVIDDIHLLSDGELKALVAPLSDPDRTVVLATQAHQQRDPLRDLVAAVERENRCIVLAGLPAADVKRAVTAALGTAPTAEITRRLMLATAGLPFLVQAALIALTTRDDGVPESTIDQAAKFAVIDRLRRVDESLLDVLLLTSLTPDLGPTDVGGALGIPAEEASLLVDRARAGGLIEQSHNPAFLSSVHSALTQIVGNARHHEIEMALLRSQIEMSSLSQGLALRLAEHGLRDNRLAANLAEQAADIRGRSAGAARLYRAAIDAGAEGLTSRLADALAMTGDSAGAAALADDLLSSEDPAERAAAVRIAAGVAAHDGKAGQAAELFSWLGPYPDAVISAAAAITFVAAGDLTAARAALRPDSAGPPTAAARASRNLAEGLLLTVDQPYPVAVAKLGQALAVEQSITEVIPDSPAALVTLAALHGGDPARARSIIGRAARAGGDALFERRHSLLLGWVKMRDGQLSSASADVTAADSKTPTILHRRDALWAVALRTAIARRSGDAGALENHWYAAMDVLAEYSVDLFTLLPLGELWAAAARLRQVDRLHHTLDQAFALLDSLGNPPLWSVPLHWAGVHAGILTNSPESVAPHGQALAAAADDSVLARALAGAGRAWLRVLASQVDPDEVAAAARALAQFGLTWDATRLTGQAALQTPDPRVSGSMLQLARDLKMTATAAESADTEPADGATPAGRVARSPLSNREREVAELLLLGLPYRDIGSQLFISAKTVEHHVARIRRRLGAESRSEMLSLLRAILVPQN